MYVWIVYAVILYIYSFRFAGLGAGAPEGRAYTIGAQGGCTLLRLADFCDASRMMLAKIRALRQFSFGCFVRRTRRMRTARKKRCAIPLTRSKELFQPDARSDLLHFGSRAPPWSLREGRESRGGREGESKPPPSPSGPAERKTVKARQRPLFVFPSYHRPAVWASAAF